MPGKPPNRGHLIASRPQPGHLVGKRSGEPDLSRGTMQAIGEKLASAGATSMSRQSIDPAQWTAAYRIDLGTGADWGAVQEALSEMADDDALVAAIGKQRGTQVIAEFAYGNRRKGRTSRTEFASMSAARRPDIALNQAATFDESKYHKSFVTALVFYFR